MVSASIQSLASIEVDVGITGSFALSHQILLYYTSPEQTPSSMAGSCMTFPCHARSRSCKTFFTHMSRRAGMGLVDQVVSLIGCPKSLTTEASGLLNYSLKSVRRGRLTPRRESRLRGRRGGLAYAKCGFVALNQQAAISGGRSICCNQPPESQSLRKCLGGSGIFAVPPTSQLLSTSHIQAEQF